MQGGCTIHTQRIGLDDYMADIKARNHKPLSMLRRADALKLFFAYLEQQKVTALRDVTLQHLDAYRLKLVERKLCVNTVYAYLRYVKDFFRHLEMRGLVFENPTRDLTLPKLETRLQHVPSEDDIKRLLAQPDTTTPVGIRDRTFLEVAYGSALRLEELVRMNVSDPDLDRGLVRVLGKGSRERVVPLGRQAVVWLRRYIDTARPKLLKADQNEPALWLGARWGHRWHLMLVEQMVRSSASQAGIGRVTPHALRRACATHMLCRGAHPVQIQSLLGHASMGTMGRYLRVCITDIRSMHQQSNLGS